MAFNSTNATLGDVLAHAKVLEDSLAVAWILLCSFLVISMQLGFAMLEVGSVRQAHRMTVLAKNIMDSTVSCVGFWAYTQFESYLGADSGVKERHLLLFQWAFCATSVTICSGSMAERTHMLAYLCYALVMAALIYPVLASSAWGQAGPLYRHFHGMWISGHKYHDFAGTGVVHFVGGMSALVGNVLLGRRIMRPQSNSGGSSGVDGVAGGGIGEAGHPLCPHRPEGSRAEPASSEDPEEVCRMMSAPREGWPRRFDSAERDVTEFKPLNYLQVVGMFTLWVGWYGFNAGSTFCMSRTCSMAAGIVAWNTTMAACCGGLGAYLYCYSVSKNLDTTLLCNGVLSGLVSITGCCDVATESQAAIIGLGAGLIVYPVSCRLFRWLLIDDPVDALPVHAVCGLYGVLAVAFCTPDCGMLALAGGGLEEQDMFCRENHTMGKQMVEQAWGLFTLLWWTVSTSAALWGFFAISELARSFEVAYLEMADQLVGQMVVPETGLPEAKVKWKDVVRFSPLARRVLRRHGWTSAGFVTSDSAGAIDVEALRKDLRDMAWEKAETGLEVGRKSPLRVLAKVVHAVRPFRELAHLRLRIAPVSELSGLGAADMDGGSLAATLRKISDAQRDHHATHSPLKQEVRELSRMVHSQDMMLRAMWRRPRGRRNSPAEVTHRLPSVPEQGEQSPSTDGGVSPAGTAIGSATLEASCRGPSDPGPSCADSMAATSSGEALEARLGVASPSAPGGRRAPPRMTPLLLPSLPRSNSSTTMNTDRTVSDHSDGRLTPHSAAEGTPPPTVIGMRNHAAMANTGQVAEVAGQLANMLQAQQSLITTLAHLATPPGGGGLPAGLPAAAAGQQDILTAALQRLVQQQQQQAAAWDGASGSLPTSISFSTTSTSPRHSVLGGSVPLSYEHALL